MIFNEYHKSAISIRKVSKEQVNKYGIVEAKNISEYIYEINDLVEKPEINQVPSNLAIVGRYVLTPVFDKIDKIEENSW